MEGWREYYSCLQSDCVEKYRLSNVNHVVAERVSSQQQTEGLEQDKPSLSNVVFVLSSHAVLKNSITNMTVKSRYLPFCFMMQHDK